MNRYYANNNGRFTSVDKGGGRIHAPVTMNRYLYQVTIQSTSPMPPATSGKVLRSYHFHHRPGCKRSGGSGAAAGEWSLSCPDAGPSEEVDPLEEAFEE
jgi:hypothetical protein